MSASGEFVVDRLRAQWRLSSPLASNSGESPPLVRSGARVPMWSFVAGDERLVCDRAVQIEFGEGADGFFASCERLHVYSSGESYDECMRDIQQQIVHFFHDYTSLADEDVVGLAQELRSLYKAHFGVAS